MKAGFDKICILVRKVLVPKLFLCESGEPGDGDGRSLILHQYFLETVHLVHSSNAAVFAHRALFVLKLLGTPYEVRVM